MFYRFKVDSTLLKGFSDKMGALHFSSKLIRIVEIKNTNWVIWMLFLGHLDASFDAVLKD